MKRNTLVTILAFGVMFLIIGLSGLISLIYFDELGVGTIGIIAFGAILGFFGGIAIMESWLK